MVSLAEVAVSFSAGGLLDSGFNVSVSNLIGGSEVVSVSVVESVISDLVEVSV